MSPVGTSLRTFLLQKRLRVHTYKTHLSGSPSTETKRVGQRTDEYGSDAAKTALFGGGESEELPWAG